METMTFPENFAFRDVQEMILGVWAQIQEWKARGQDPQKVLMTVDQYKRLRLYHSYVGKLPDSAPDYLDEDYLFGLEICLEQAEFPRLA